MTASGIAATQVASAMAATATTSACCAVAAILAHPPAADGARAFWIEGTDGRCGWGATLDNHTLTGFVTAEAALSAVRRAAAVTAPQGLCE